MFLEQIKKFEKAEQEFKLNEHKYKLGEKVYLKKGTFMHGIREVKASNLDSIIKEGIISSDFQGEYNPDQKTPWCISVWNIQKDILLKDYIYIYSGATIEFKFQKPRITKLVPFDEIGKEIAKFENSGYGSWKAEQTKECRYLPSLSLDIVQIGFIINTESEYAKNIIKNDLFDLNFDKEILESFIWKSFINEFIYAKRDHFTTNRESAILFGMPSCFIEGILVGRLIENNKEELKILKIKFPNSYICNLDGKVIVE